MRVTNSMMYRNFTSSTNTVHSRLNKSFNKISTGAEYEAAADSPISYYQSRKIDNQYLDVKSKAALIKDVQNRIYQQELGARDIQQVLTREGGARTIVMRARTGTTTGTALDTLSADLLQMQHEIVNSLNVQYQDFYVYGGNDLSTPPFSLSANGETLTFSHIFPGEEEATVIEMTLAETPKDSGKYGYSAKGVSGPGVDPNVPSLTGLPSDPQELLTKAMSEQGRIDIGYGTIRDQDTLLDTFTGGLNLLTGINSDAVKANAGTKADGIYKDKNGGILEYLNNSALGVIGQAKQAIDKYGTNADNTIPDSRDAAKLDEILGRVLGEMTMTEHHISSVYSDLGNKYKLMETTYDSLNKLSDNLKEQYTDIMGADAYESIIDMWENQYSYNASLKLGAQLMSSSLFDFMR